MKKLCFWLTICTLIFVGCSSGENVNKKTVSNSDENDIWEVSVQEVEEISEWKTTSQIKQYDGSFLEKEFTDVPSEGNKYVLLSLYIKKKASEKDTFKWENVYLSHKENDDSKYKRINDVFISDHEYVRITGSDIQFGENQGYACFEVPSDISLNELSLVYKTGENVRKIDFE